MSAIPYIVETRPDTGVNNVMLGVWLFLASEVMLFGGLFSAYFMLRAGAPAPWAPLTSHVAAVIVSTAVLFASTACFAAALREARGRRVRTFRRWMLAATALGLLFLPLKGLQYVDLIDAGMLPSTSTQFATYYLLTAVHAAHVLGGLLVNTRLLLTSTSAWAGSAPAAINRAEAAALYWYFVDLVWLLLVVVFYVV